MSVCNVNKNSKSRDEKNNPENSLRNIFIYKKDYMPPQSESFSLTTNEYLCSYREICPKIFKSLLSVLILIIVLAGCTSKEQKNNTALTVVNSVFSEPVKLELKEIFKLDSSAVLHPVDLQSDSKGNIYVLEYKSRYIKIFDKYGKYINEFSTDSDSLRITSFGIDRDTIFIAYAKDNKIRKFDTTARLVGEISIKNEIPHAFEFLPDGRIIGCFITNTVEKDQMFTEMELKIADRSFKSVKLLSSLFDSFYTGNIDTETPVFPFASDPANNRIYTGYSSKKVYKIFVYDTNLNLIAVIENKILQVKFTLKELEMRNEMARKFKITSGHKQEYKDFIEGMSVDIEGNLWVKRASDADKYGITVSLHDIFDKNGKYIKTIELDDSPRSGSIVISGSNIFKIEPIRSVVTAYSFSKGTGEYHEKQ